MFILKIFSRSKFFIGLVSFLIFATVISSLGFVFFLDAPPAQAQPNVQESDIWITNGQVNAIALYDNKVYIGGNFGYVGKLTGHGAPLDSSGNLLTTFPIVNGSINTSASDGAGGWYIGGSFTQVGGVAINYLAHINPDGTFDSSWNPDPDNAVSSIVVSGSTVYVGGDFTTFNAGGVTRNYIAAIPTGSSVPTAWDPDADAAVRSIAVDGSTVYIGGEFTTLNTGGTPVTRNYIAAIPTGSSVPTSWDPNADWSIVTIVPAGSIVYVGGGFTTFGGGTYTRNYLAALDASTGVPTSWNPNPSGMMAMVNTLVVSGSTVYVGGMFDTIGGQSRNNIAAIDASTGNATAWDPNSDNRIETINISGSTVYVGGGFQNIGGQARYYIAAIDASTGNATSWHPDAHKEGGMDATVYTISLHGSTIYAGGAFTFIGGAVRSCLASINLTTGKATSWDPGSGEIRSLVVSGTTLYAGGGFTTIGGQSRNHLASFDLTTGNITAWDPDANNPVNVLAVSGSTVYAGGQFTTVNGGTTRNYIAAIDASTGNATAWDPSADGQVWSIAVSGSNVYVGGEFFNIGGSARNHIAAIDASTGNAAAWDPSANSYGYVFKILIDGSIVYVGGAFTTIGGQSRNRIAALDISTGNATVWDPNANGSVYALAIYGSTVYVGGSFTNIGGQARSYLASIDSSGNATSWAPVIPWGWGAAVNSIVLGSPIIYVSGSFGGGFAQFGSSPKMSDTLSRLKVNTAANHTVKITLATDIDWDAGDTLTLTFQSDFNLGALSNADATDYDINTGVEETIVANGGCGGSDAIEIDSIAGQVITFQACPSYTSPGTNSTITIEIGTHATTGGTGDSQITNPTVAGEYDIDLGGTIGDTNACAVYIVNEDQVIVTADVDPIFTFLISSDSCNLGTMDSLTLSTCDYTLAVGTNAASGATITIQAITDGTNAWLNLDSNPSTYITNISEGNTVTIGTEGYGLALAAGTGWTEEGDFDDDDTPIPNTLTPILSTSGPISSTITSTITHRAAVSAITSAGTYSQDVQYIATGTF